MQSVAGVAGALRVLQPPVCGIIEGQRRSYPAALDNGFHIIAFNRAFKADLRTGICGTDRTGFQSAAILANDPEQMASAFISLQQALAGEVFTDIETIVVAGQIREYESQIQPDPRTKSAKRKCSPTWRAM